MSARNPRRVTAETYAVLVPTIYGSGDGRYVSSLRVDRTRSKKPSLDSGEIVVKLRLHFDEASLLSSIPVVEVDVTGFSAALPEPVAAETAPVLDA